MIEWYEMSDSVWVSSTLYRGMSFMIERTGSKYSLSGTSLGGKKVMKSGLTSFEQAKEEAEIALFWRMRK